MSKFKVGEQVVCVDGGDTRELINGLHYTVTGVDGILCTLSAFHDKTFFIDRFRRVGETTSTTRGGYTVTETIVSDTSVKTGDKDRTISLSGTWIDTPTGYQIDLGSAKVSGSPPPPPPSTTTVEGKFVTIARSIGELVETKQKAYGDSFGKSGDVMRILYPDGIPAEKVDDALTVVRVLDKLFRIATDRDALGESPWRDIAGYALLAVGRSGK